MLDSMRDELRQQLKTVKAELVERTRPKRKGFASVQFALTELRRATDDVLQKAWNALHMPASWALVAVGGYGRGELFLHSDVDVLVLIDSEPTDNDSEKLQALFGLGWDIGMELGHSVRSVQDCLKEAEKDITVQTALLEARLLCGQRSLFNRLKTACNAQLHPQHFFQAKVLELKQRYAKYQDTPYSLEPNCKESPGGLRDIHVLLWVCKAAGYGDSWADLSKNGFITPLEARQLKRNESILKCIRFHLHAQVNRREDRLVFDVQHALAQRLGFEAHKSRRASELLMQQYYWAARAVLQLNTILLQNIEARLFERSGTPTPIDDDFQNVDELLDLRDEGVFERNPTAMLRAFLVMQQHAELKGMSARLIRALWNERMRIDARFRRDPKNRALFIEILQQPRGIVHELRRMAQTSVLGRYLPVFRAIIGQMQHDLFHVYTVDQHIMQVIRNVRRFTMPEHAHEYPFCSQLMANFDRHWLLYVAALFHDIAKGRGGDHSELGVPEVLKFAKQHGLSAQDSELLGFLVRHHLTMSNVAQKKDLSDPDVILEFARTVKDERHLTALYLLTVADIRGTSPKVWNNWKGKLLEDLYRLTLRALGGSVPSAGQQLAERKEEARRILRLYALSDDAHETLWSKLDVAYFLRNDASDIAWHTRQLYWRSEKPESVVKTRLAPSGVGLQVLVYCPDQADLFARICGYFDSKNLSILDAKIQTTQHGFALDSFIINNPWQTGMYRELLSLIENELKDRLQRQAELDAPVKGRMSRQSKHFPITPSVDLRQDEKGQYHLLTLSAPDRTGLLYSVACVLARHKVNLHTAKVLTLGERVEDTFLVSGSVLSSAKAQIQLETELLEALA